MARNSKVKATVVWDADVKMWKVEVWINGEASGSKWFEKKRVADAYKREKESMRI